jgi:hypothetical protein
VVEPSIGPNLVKPTPEGFTWHKKLRAIKKKLVLNPKPSFDCHMNQHSFDHEHVKFVLAKG